MRYKELHYYYPNSPGAESRGLGNLGCWVIQVDRKDYAVTPDKLLMLTIWEQIEATISTNGFTPNDNPTIFDRMLGGNRP